MNNHDELDNIVDHALSEYRNAEPLAGLEDRVLRRIASRGRQTRRMWWWSAAAVATSAVILVALWFGRHDGPSGPSLDSSVRQQARTAHVREPEHSANKAPSNAVVAVDEKLKHRPAARIATSRKDASELAGFNQLPSPAPLSAAERSLLALAKARPDLFLNQPDNERDVEIAPVEIKSIIDRTAGDRTAGEGEDQ